MALVFSRAGDVLRDADVLLGCQRRDQVESLEHEAHHGLAQLRPFGVCQVDQFVTGQADASARRCEHSADDVKQSRLSGARRAEHGGEFPGLDLERDSSERGHVDASEAKHLAQALDLDNRGVNHRDFLASLVRQRVARIRLGRLPSRVERSQDRSDDSQRRGSGHPTRKHQDGNQRVSDGDEFLSGHA